jgi:type I restriction enzyme, S subunit
MHRSIKEAVCVLGGSTPSKSKTEFWEGNIPWVSPKDMKDVILSDTADHITKEAIKNSAANLLPKEAVLLVVRSGILAHSVPIAITQTMVAINQDIKAFISNPSDFNPWYLLAFMISAKELLLGCVKRGVTVHSIDMSKLRNLSIIKLPLSLQEQFGKIFRDLLQGQQQRRIRAERVDHLFNVLLQKAFSGALTVKWREAHMKEVLEEMEHQARALGQ